MRPYQYPPLGTVDIRLWSLLPGAFSSDIGILLDREVFSGSCNIPASEALSYTWVSAEDPVVISINPSNTQPSNNAKLLGTQNLAAALPSST